MIVLVYTHEVISTTLDVNIRRRKGFKVDLIDISLSIRRPFCLDFRTLESE